MIIWGSTIYKVLLVDDDIAERFLHKRMRTWADCGFLFAGEASDGSSALRLLEREKFDLVVTDIRMPFMDGIELLKSIREKDSKIPVIFISSYSEFQYVKEGIVYGVFDYLTKPVNPDKLADVLNRVKQRIEEQKEVKIDAATQELLEELKVSADEDEFVRHIAEFSTEHYKEEITCDDCACIFGYHEKYFGKIFIQHFSISFRDYWGRVKIAHAIELIRSGLYRAVEVSDMLGFSSYKYFSKKFKDITGVAPTDYKFVSKERK